jgi:alpha-ketoglutarate-dependent taurine dioxygenase
MPIAPVISHPADPALASALESAGAVLLRNLDPDTPDELLRVGKILGSLEVGIEEDLLGPRIMHLRYDSAKVVPAQKPAYFTADHFPLHTDVSYVPNPPRFMLLHCVHPDPGGGGSSQLADCGVAFALLDESDHKTLSTSAFRFRYPPNCTLGESDPFPICDQALWRFKYTSMRIPEFASGAVERFHQALTKISVSLLLSRGDLLIVDNHRIAHGRSAFRTPQRGLPERHLMRLYATSSG